MPPTSHSWPPPQPLTPNGKLDRRALPAARAEVDGAPPTARCPGTPTEQTVAEIWRRVLGVDQVGVDQKFFELGGHSLSLMKVYGQLREVFGSKVSLADLFRYPTVRTQARFLDGKEPSAALMKVALARAEARNTRQVKKRGGRGRSS
jgi:acyl carrier protein